MPKLSLLSDQALGETTTDASDGLGFQTYASVLASAALQTQGPFTIGVFGEWGTGKTSLMRLVQQKLAAEENVVTVWFNAWRYEQEEHPIVPLVGTIIRELERRQSLIGRAEAAGKALVRALRAVAYGFSAKSKVKVPGFAEIEASFVAKDMIDRDHKLTPDPLLDRSLYYEAFEGLNSLKLEHNIRIVVLVDDLDRCFPDQAIRLLESIKLVLSQPGFIFFLGVARQVIEGYLQHRYSTTYGIADFKGQLYLDKIVQLPFFIPPNAARMQSLCDAMITRLDSAIGNQLAAILPPIGEALGGNPRAVIRFINNILIDLAISSELSHVNNHENIPIEFFALSRCLQQRWPGVYSGLLNDGIAREVLNWDRDALNAHVNSPERDRSEIASTILADRRLERLLFSQAGRSWLEATELRKASINFLRTQDRISPPEKAPLPQYDVFLSHEREDRSEILPIAESLTSMGLMVFLDKEQAPGANWQLAFELSLLASKAVFFCVGRTSISDWRRRQIEVAKSKAAANPKFRIVPVLLPGCETFAVPPELEPFQEIDLRGRTRDQIFQELVAFSINR